MSMLVQLSDAWCCANPQTAAIETHWKAWAMLQLSSSPASAEKARFVVGGAFALWALASLIAPAMGQPQSFHDFAAQRALGWLPHAGDVLSNLGFLMAALAGAGLMFSTREQRLPKVVQVMAALFFFGLFSSFVGSSFYHWAPHDLSLAWDRLGMSAAFAGMLGLAVQQRVNDDASAYLAGGSMLVACLAAVAISAQTGNVLPWALLQGGGVLAMLALACLPHPRSTRSNGLAINLWAVVGFYALAKLLELGDGQVFGCTHQLISGHSSKHLVAALAALPVLSAFVALRKRPSTIGD